MSSYGDLAWTYSEEDLGIDPDTKLKFVPNKKELDLFKQEKTDMYKGTWMVCFIYGISAVILLSIIFFTDWGRTYVYDKFLPAVITYVLGAIFIIIYLVTSIFSLMPRKIGKRNDAMPICPDYWRLEETTESERTDIVNNIQTCRDGPSSAVCSDIETGIANKQYILKNSTDPVINSKDSKHLKYKCVPDKRVYGSIDDFKNNKNELNSGDSAQFKESKSKSGNNTYIYRELGEGGDNDDNIKKYAQVSGIYKNNWVKNTHVGASITDGTITANRAIYSESINNDYDYKKNPLVCNVVYPGIIGAMEDNKTTDKLRCEYADKCGISWSKLDCLTNNK